MKRDLELAGAIVFNVHGHAMQSSGWPDLLVFHRKLPGGCAGLELKMQGGAERTNQLVKIKKLNDRMFRCFIVRYWKDGDLTFEAVLKGEPVQVLRISGWQESASSGNKAERRERGHVILGAVNEAWDDAFGSHSGDLPFAGNEVMNEEPEEEDEADLLY